MQEVDRAVAEDSAAQGIVVPALEFRDLAKSYGKVDALRGLNLSVRPGEVYGFLGRNGAGKSTAIRIAMGISKPSAGQAVVFGQPLASQAIAARRHIGYVAQEQAFYGWMTVRSIGASNQPQG